MMDSDKAINGPGKLCAALGITGKQNNINTCKSAEIYLADAGISLKTTRTPRIGIKKNTHKKWRFVVKV